MGASLGLFPRRLRLALREFWLPIVSYLTVTENYAFGFTSSKVSQGDGESLRSPAEINDLANPAHRNE